jgi:hypothetical protein
MLSASLKSNAQLPYRKEVFDLSLHKDTPTQLVERFPAVFFFHFHTASHVWLVWNTIFLDRNKGGFCSRDGEDGFLLFIGYK